MWQRKENADVLYACKDYEARLEDVANGAVDPAGGAELGAHLERCAACREALRAAREGRELLRAGLEPAPEPSSAFAAGVLAGIRVEEARRLAGGEFWRPLEVLASRLALTAAAALVVLTVFLFEFAPAPNREWVSSNQSQVSEGFPEPASQPTDKDEILLTLAENGHGR